MYQLHTNAWIGLSTIASNRVFLWSDNEAVTYTNWATSEPNDQGVLFAYAICSLSVTPHFLEFSDSDVRSYVVSLKFVYKTTPFKNFHCD